MLLFDIGRYYAIKVPNFSRGVGVQDSLALYMESNGLGFTYALIN